MSETATCRVQQADGFPLDKRAEEEEYGRLSGTLAIPLGQRGITFQLAPADGKSGVMVTLAGDLPVDEMLGVLDEALKTYNTRPYPKTEGVLVRECGASPLTPYKCPCCGDVLFKLGALAESVVGAADGPKMENDGAGGHFKRCGHCGSSVVFETIAGGASGFNFRVADVQPCLKPKPQS